MARYRVIRTETIIGRQLIDVDAADIEEALAMADGCYPEQWENLAFDQYEPTHEFVEVRKIADENL